MLRVKLLLIHIVIIFLIGCSDSKDTEINQNPENKYEKGAEKKELTNEFAQEQEEFTKLKENMGDNNYGIKKETLTISDTSHKNMNFKINYPYFYTIYDNEIFYQDFATDDLLISIQKEIFNENAINNFGVESSRGYGDDVFDYEISYQDKNFFCFYYSGVIEEYGTMQFSHPFYLTRNIYIDSDKEYLTIKEITLDDILPISEVEKYLNENNKKLLKVYKDPELEEEIASYFGDINKKIFQLKDNSKMNVCVNLPRRLGSYAIFEMEYNWRDKLLNKDVNK